MFVTYGERGQSAREGDSKAVCAGRKTPPKCGKDVKNRGNKLKDLLKTRHLVFF
jgi:hypothetical protein